MTDLAAEGDGFWADIDHGAEFARWAMVNWPAIAAALRERDDIATRALEKVARAHELYDRAEARAEAQRVRAVTAEARCHDMGIAWEKDIERACTAEADADRLAALLDRKALKHSTRTVEEGGFIMHLDMKHDPEVAEALAAHAAAVETRP